MKLNQNDSTVTLMDHQQQENVPSVPVKKEEEILMLATEENPQNNTECDDNQNNVNNRMSLMQNFNVNAAGERILVNLKQLLMLYAKLKRQLMEFTEVKVNEQSSYKAKCDEMSSQVRLYTLSSYFKFYVTPFIALNFAVDVTESRLGIASNAGRLRNKDKRMQCPSY
jgi:hypothetical protein